MTPREIWCNEAQERYVLAIRASAICDRFRRDLRARALPVRRRRAGARADGALVVDDPHFDNAPVDMELDVMLGKPPKMTRDVARTRAALRAARSRRRHRARRRVSRAAVSGGRRQDIPGHDRRSHRRRPLRRAIRWSVRGRCRSPTSR